MAYLDPTQDEDAENNPQSQVVTGGAPQGGGANQAASQNQAANPTPLTGSGGGMLSPGGAASPATGQGPAKASSSGSWTNLQNYLDANTDQAAQMGNQIAGNLNQEGSSAQNAIGKAQDTFNTGVSSSGADLSTEQPFIDQAVAGAGKAPDDQTTDSRYSQDLSATYSGPKQLSDIGQDYTDAQGALNHYNEDADLSKTEAGRDTLLQNQYGAEGNYNQGQQNLDQILLEGNPSAQSSLQGATQNWSGLSNALSNNAASDQEAATARAASTQAVNQYAHDTLGTAVSDLGTTINGEVSSGNSANTAAYNKVISDLKTGNPIAYSEIGALAGTGPDGAKPTLPQVYGIRGPGYQGPRNTAPSQDYSQLVSDLENGNPLTSSDLSTLNASPNDPNSSSSETTYGIDPTQYLSAGPSYTTATAATAGDLARWQGLNSLIGSAPTGADLQSNLQQIFGTSGVPTAAGNPINPYTFDNASFQGAVSNAGKSYGDQLSKLTTTLDADTTFNKGQTPQDEAAILALLKQYHMDGLQ